MNDVVWKLFKETGDIKYYILLKNMNKRSDQMKIEKVEGIVIGETNYSESSKILNILTKEYGIIGVMSKGYAEENE